MNIKIQVADKRATVEGSPIIVCGNSDYSIDFTFDTEWEGEALKTARFVYVQNGTAKYQDVSFTGSTVKVPVLSNTREVKVGVFAGDLQTTTPARIRCEPSILCGSMSEDPTPGGGGSGGNYAPADAIVDQSLESDWYSGRYERPDTAIFEYWKWEKRIDGTFTLRGGNTNGCISELEEDEEIYEGDVLWGEDYLPFNIYDAEWTYSCVIINNENGDEENIDISDTIMFDFVVYHDIDELLDSDFVGLAITRTEEALEQLRNAGLSSATVYTSIQITGRWRKD